MSLDERLIVDGPLEDCFAPGHSIIWILGGWGTLPVTPVRSSVLPCRTLVPAIAGTTNAVAPFTSRRIVLPPLRESRSAPDGVRQTTRFFRRGRWRSLISPEDSVARPDSLA